MVGPYCTPQRRTNPFLAFQAQQNLFRVFSLFRVQMADRKALAVEWLKQKHLGLYIIVNVGSQCVEDSIGTTETCCFLPYLRLIFMKLAKTFLLLLFVTYCN